MGDELNEGEELATRLVGRGLAEAMRGEDFDALRAWVAGRADELLVAFPGQSPPAGAAREDAVRRISYAFATLIWNRAPLPSNGYRPLPRPAAGRNDSCPCGSGEKHKRCCGGGRSPLPSFSDEEAYALLARQASDQELERLIADRRLTPELLAALADELNERDTEAAAVALTPWFDEPSQLDERHEQVLEIWLESRANTEGAKDFIELALDVEDELPEELKPVAWRALIPPAIVMRDVELAKDMLSLLLEETPNDPTLAQLEVTTLLVAGELRQAAERARFWLSFVRRHGLAEALEDVVDPLEAVARDPEAAARDFRAAEQPVFAELAQAVAQAAGRPVRPYAIEVHGDDALLGRPPADVVAVEAAWEDVRFAAGEAEDAEADDGSGDDDGDGAAALGDDFELTMRSIERQTALAKERPEALDSLAILEDLAAVADEAVELDSGWSEPLLQPLLARAEAILRASLAQAPSARLPWSFLENRPALSLLALRAGSLERQGRDDEAARVYEELLRLNPTDNGGHRARLVDHALRCGQPERALAIAEGYPNDALVELTFGVGLALWRLGRRAEAEEALRTAAVRSPLVARMLTAEKEPEKPEIEDGYVSVGGEDEAWLYREEMLEVWQQTPDALDFLKSLRPPLLSLRRPRRG